MLQRIKSYLLSLLTFQYIAKPNEFLRLHPHAWLVWEPGQWTPPADLAGAEATRLPSQKMSHPVGGDALCFELDPKLAMIKVGRAPECEVLINDATVSREHLVLQTAGSGWTAEVVPQAKSTAVSGLALSSTAPVPLAFGAKLEIGQVELSLLTPEQMQKRVVAAAKKLGSPR